jgi:hypothetical protein
LSLAVVTLVVKMVVKIMGFGWGRACASGSSYDESRPPATHIGRCAVGERDSKGVTRPDDSEQRRVDQAGRECAKVVVSAQTCAQIVTSTVLIAARRQVDQDPHVFLQQAPK